MGESNTEARLAVINGLQRIIEKDPYKSTSRSEIKKISNNYIDGIISQAKIDRNYLIRNSICKALCALDVGEH